MTSQRIVIDACVLYPTVMREMVLGVAGQGVFVPLWSERILEEWAQAATRLGPEGAAQARAEIALLRAAWPDATRPAAPEVEARLWLPDEDDRHVLAIAVAEGAGALMTLNARDFPRGTLADEGVVRVDPDGFLMDVWMEKPDAVEEVAAKVLGQARKMSGGGWEMRGLLKKARLPRLGKALG